MDSGKLLSQLTDLLQLLPDDSAPQTAPGTWECAFRLLKKKEGDVLVAGAGRGGLSWLLNKVGFNVSSVDLHPEHFIIKNMACSFADLNKKMEFDDQRFEVILAVEVMEHLENPWFFLREAIRCLKQDGELIFTTPNVESIASRMAFMLGGELSYFKEPSFVGCYHVTPIYSWAIERCCRTTTGSIEAIEYSRFDWPSSDDVPKHDGGRGLRRKILDSLPLNKLTGEIVGYRIRKNAMPPSIDRGKHSS
ncbi:MAG: methyltransferase domain-containing protein [Gammaproteobacteria bacterium]|nr:methyltransferase domain-containing protein [Gammaproteobacteria bacterium]MBU1978204.1 methyltransferase domain-containing protein [Gammaproteobacteria bacterium]